jgi:hypothetical protein
MIQSVKQCQQRFCLICLEIVMKERSELLFGIPQLPTTCIYNTSKILLAQNLCPLVVCRTCHVVGGARNPKTGKLFSMFLADARDF